LIVENVVKRIPLFRILKVMMACAALLASRFSSADLTDLSNLPLSSAVNLDVKPNILFILDDSASMGWEFMPDGVGTRKNTVGFRNGNCNQVYYNPLTVYAVPQTSAQTPINSGIPTADWGTVTSTFSAALDDGFYVFDGGALTQIDLRNGFRSHILDTPQAAYYWSYLGSNTLAPLAPDCNMALASASDAVTNEICSDATIPATTCTAAGKTALWRKVLVSATSGPNAIDERQNFANWFSYYRTRLNMMKSASGLAIVPLTESYRVGFMTIDPMVSGAVDSSKFSPVSDFNPGNKAAWFKQLYSQKVNNITPLLTALSRAGRYYAGRMDGINSGIHDDPMQYACQQNFTILTTDGNWNGDTAYDLDGRTDATLNVINQDGNILELDAYNDDAHKFLVSPRPIYDGSGAYTWKSAQTEYRDNTACVYATYQQITPDVWSVRTVQNQQKTVLSQTRNTQLQTRTTQLQARSLQYHRRTVQNQQRIVQNQQLIAQAQTQTTQLMKTYTQLQRRSVQVQKQTIQWQTRVTQLQTRTTQLQKTSTQLQGRTTQLQSRSIQYQRLTQQLQQQTLQLQQRTARFRACSGPSGSGSCVDLVFDCTEPGGTTDPAKPYCYVTNDTGYHDVTSCTPSSTEVSATVCRVTDSGWSDAALCLSPGTPSRQVNCRTVTTQDWTNVGGCAEGFSNGITTSCRFSDSGWINAGNCSESNPADGPTVSCRIDDSGYSNVGTCSAHGLDANGQTVFCQTTPPTTVDAGSCTVAPINGAGETVTACTTTNPPWSNTSTCANTPLDPATGRTSYCQTVITQDWANSGACTASPIDGAGVTVDCQQASNSGLVNVGSCVPSAPGAQPTVTCQILGGSDTGWQNSGACVESSADPGPTVSCQSPQFTVAVGSCAVAPIDASGVTVIACTTVPSGWSETPSCTETPFDPGTGLTVQCRAMPSWVDVLTCPPGNIVIDGVTYDRCRVAWDTGWQNVGPCMESFPPSGPMQTCRVASDVTDNVAFCFANPLGNPTVTCSYTDSGFADMAAAACPPSNFVTGPIVSCQMTDPGWTNTGVCTDTPIDPATGQDVECQTAYSPWSSVASCTEVPPDASGAGIGCQDIVDDWTNVGSCTESNGSPTVSCRVTSDTTTSASACSESSPATGPTVTCTLVSSGHVDPVDSCTPSPTCNVINNPGHQLQSRLTATEGIYVGPNQTGLLVSTRPLFAPTDWTDVAACSPAIPDVPVPSAIVGGGPPAPPAGCAAWPCETATPSDGSLESLADVAQYYYKTDLRTPELGNCEGPNGNLCDNIVKPVGTGGPEDDKASWQHMTTFTLGLGVSGSLAFKQDYKTSLTGDFVGLRTGTLSWPVPVRDPTKPDRDVATPEFAIDDLWHAAVNGRGQYFSAAVPSSVLAGLGQALRNISAATATGAAAAVSSIELKTNNNFVYLSSYSTQKWTGDLIAYAMNQSGAITLDPPAWDAKTLLQGRIGQACDNRTIWLYRQTAANHLVNFALNTYACDASGNPTGSAVTPGLNGDEQGNFNSTQVENSFSQFLAMSPAQRAASAGANLVNYLRGQKGKEGFVSGDINKLFRARDSALGDIISSAPTYVGPPSAAYSDPGYQDFRGGSTDRTPMIYVEANDGMLHAFRAEDGSEAWALIPTFSLPNLVKLASENYGNQHVFLLDGTPVVEDVCAASDCSAATATDWRTILVSGLRRGGKGYFAMDVTNPESPKALWEFKAGTTCFNPAGGDQFTDCDLGYSYGSPIVAKLKTGKWVVFVASGYNNGNDPPLSGNGGDYLYVLDAMSGKILNKIRAGDVGDGGNPSGMANISARVTEALRNKTAQYVYGTDLLGNIWRFDVNGQLLPSGVGASLLAQAVDPSGHPQPITTAPMVAVVNNEPYVFVGTGRYLGASDLTGPNATQIQTIWGIKDPMTAEPVTNLRSTLAKITSVTRDVAGATAPIAQSTTAYRTNSCLNPETDNCGSTFGWYTDLSFPNLPAGERVNIDPKLELGTLIVGSNVPPATACEVGGTGWVNFFNARTGLAVPGSINNSTATRVLGSTGQLSQLVGMTVIRAGGRPVVKATTLDGGVGDPYVAFGDPKPQGKRVTWREIVQ
jgi:Tfp pilus tip-associated adhesin PilY1